MARVQPALLRLMKACAAKVDGEIEENSLQKAGKAVSGHENPVRNRHTGDMNRNSTNTVSRRVMRLLKVRLNVTQAAR